MAKMLKIGFLSAFLLPALAMGQAAGSCSADAIPNFCQDFGVAKFSRELMPPCEAFFKAAHDATSHACQFVNEGRHQDKTTEGANQAASMNKAGDQYQAMVNHGKKWKPVVLQDQKVLKEAYTKLEAAIKELVKKAKQTAYEEIVECGVKGTPVSLQLFAVGRLVADAAHLQGDYLVKVLKELGDKSAEFESKGSLVANKSHGRAEREGDAGRLERNGVGEAVQAVGEATALVSAMRVVEERLGTIATQAVEGITHLHVSIFTGALGAGLDFAIRYHRHALDQTDFTFLLAGAAAGISKSFGMSLVWGLFATAAEFTVRWAWQGLVRQSYEDFEGWYQRNVGANMSQALDSSTVASRYHDTTVMDNGPDPQNRGLPMNSNVARQCPNNHSCTPAAQWQLPSSLCGKI